MRSKLFKNIQSAIIIKSLSAFIGFIITFFVGYYFGASEAGKYFYFYSLTLLLSGFVRLGLDNFTLKEMPSYYTKGELSNVSQHFSISITIICLSSIFLSLVMLLFSTSIGINFKCIYAITFLPFAIVAYIGIFYQSLGQVTKGLLYSVLIPQVCMAIFIVSFSNNVENVMYFFASLYYLLLLGLVILLHKYFIRFQFKKILTTLKRSKSFVLISLFGIVNVNYAPLIISHFLSFSDNALFTVSLKVATINVFILSALNSVIAPKFSLLHSTGDLAGVKNLAKKSTRFMAVFSFPLFLVMVLFPEMILTFFGKEYNTSEGVCCLQILAFSQFINVSTGATSYLLQMVGLSFLFSKLLIGLTTIAILIALAFVDAFGLLGVVSVVALSSILLNVASLISIKIKLNFWMI